LDDEELDSGDDLGRKDRLEDSDQEVEQRVINTVDISLGRHNLPHGSDGEVCSAYAHHSLLISSAVYA
jgi:RNA polymerase-associated protein LEO1